MEVTEILYKLIYHRSFRTSFKKEDFDDFFHMDLGQLEKTAQQVVSQFLCKSDPLGFRREFQQTLKLWREKFPVDESGIELVYLFLESAQFERVEHIATSSTSLHLFQAFREFMESKLPIDEEFKALRMSLRKD